MPLRLVLPGLCHREQYLQMMAEWQDYGGRLNPGALRNKGAPYETWLQWMRNDADEATCPPGNAPSTLYFLVDENETLLGAISLRHRLTPELLQHGGHTGYGIRPSARQKGYATQMLALALEQFAQMGIDKVLVTCATDNTASEKVILANGGVYEDTRPDDEGELVKRYWICR